MYPVERRKEKRVVVGWRRSGGGRDNLFIALLSRLIGVTMIRSSMSKVEMLSYI